MEHVFDPQESEASAQETFLPKGELLLGTLLELDSLGAPKVKCALDGQWRTVTATPAVSVQRHHIGRQAVLMLAGGDIQAPVLLGFVHSPLDTALEASSQKAAAEDIEVFERRLTDVEGDSTEVEVDGQRRVIEGREQVVLRCGEASITLTRAGKIILRGKHLVSRSSGVNRILGGSIQMN